MVWLAAARRYTDSPSLGRCVHHARRQGVQPILRRRVHPPRFTPIDWEFEVLTKLIVVGQPPVRPDESKTHAISFLGPTLSIFDSPSGNHCTVIPKSKGVRSHPNKRAGKDTSARNDPSPNKRAGKDTSARNDPSKRVKIIASASMVQLDEDKEEIGAPYCPIQDAPVPSPTKPIFTTEHTHANEGILTQLTSELVATRDHAR